MTYDTPSAFSGVKNTEPWALTSQLRYAKDGTLQQRWHRRIITYRKYNGIDRRVEDWESCWLPVPTEGQESLLTPTGNAVTPPGEG